MARFYYVIHIIRSMVEIYTVCVTYKSDTDLKKHICLNIMISFYYIDSSRIIFSG